jgi:hypothetical protein
MLIMVTLSLLLFPRHNHQLFLALPIRNTLLPWRVQCNAMLCYLCCFTRDEDNGMMNAIRSIDHMCFITIYHPFTLLLREFYCLY